MAGLVDFYEINHITLRSSRVFFFFLYTVCLTSFPFFTGFKNAMFEYLF